MPASGQAFESEEVARMGKFHGKKEKKSYAERYYGYICHESATIAKWYCPFVAMLSVICAARGILLGAYGDGVLQLGSAIIYTLIPPYAARLNPRNLSFVWPIVNVYRGFVMLAYGLKWVKCWSACLLAGRGGVVALYLVEAVLFGPLQQADLWSTLLARAINAACYGPFFASQKVEPSYLAAFGMFVITGGTAIALDFNRRKVFHKLVKQEGSRAEDEMMPWTSPVARSSKVSVERAAENGGAGARRDDSDHSHDSDFDFNFVGLEELMVKEEEASDASEVLSSLTDDETAELVKRLVAEVDSFDAYDHVPDVPVKVSVYIPWSHPNELKEDSMIVYKALLAERFPGLEAPNISIHEGSLHVMLGVLFTGTSAPPTRPGGSSATQVVTASVEPRHWFNMLQLPWPKDGAPVIVQVGSTATAVSWDEGKHVWKEDAMGMEGMELRTRTPVHSVYPIAQVIPDVADHDDGSSSSLSLTLLASNEFVSGKQGACVLKARHRGSVGKVVVCPEDMEMMEDMDSAENISGCTGSLNFGGRKVSERLIRSLDSAQETECVDEHKLKFDRFTVSVLPQNMPFFSTVYDINGRASLNKYLPCLSAVEVWNGRVLVQSIPFLALPKSMSGMATEVSHFASEMELGKMDLPCAQLHAMIGKIGSFLDYAALLADSESSCSRLHLHMENLGRWLLELCCLRGWVETANVMLQQLTTHFHCLFKRLARSSNQNRHSLLHLAIIGGKSYMVAQVIKWGSHHKAPFSWTLVDDHGVTPLHLAALKHQDGRLVHSILRHFESARDAWHTAKGGLGVTPAAIAKQLKMNVSKSFPESSKPSSRLMGPTRSRFGNRE